MSRKLNIKIIGAGPTGSLLAIALADSECNISIFDHKNINELKSRNRAYALTHSSRKLLEYLNLWTLLKEKTNKFSKLTVQDSTVNRFINFNLSNLSIKNRSSGGIGWIINHIDLMDVIYKRLLEYKNINFQITQETNYDLENYDYVIAADGTQSKSRINWNIGSFKFKYNQCCFTSKVLVRNGENDRAFEVLREEGPFAILPMKDDIYQVVWSASLEKCKTLKNNNKSYVLDRISSIMPMSYQPDVMIEDSNYYSNYFSIARSFYRNRFILVGEAAHSFHPVGGQGLNLCWRDIYQLTRLIKFSQKYRNKFDNFIPFIYFLLRIPDVIFVALSTDSLVRVFSNNNNFLILIRKISFLLLKRSKLLKTNILSLMTNGINIVN